MSDEQEVIVSSGNLYADFGFPEPEIALAKADLARKLIAIIHARGLTQAAAGEVLGINQPKVSAIMRGRLKEFSLERLAQCLTRFNQDVEISVMPSRDAGRSIGRIAVHDDCAPEQDLPMAASSRAGKKGGVEFS